MTWVIVPAAGLGQRLGGGTPKQYMPLLGEAMVLVTLKRLARVPEISAIMLGLSREDALWPGLREVGGKRIVRFDGGAVRADTVYNGLCALPAQVTDEDWVLVHDAARPCVRPNDVSQLIMEGAHHEVGAILASRAVDTMKQTHSADSMSIKTTLNRERIWHAQTPQMFRRGELMSALQMAYIVDTNSESESVTDEASAFELIGLEPAIVEGSRDNIKVTTKLDLLLAESILIAQMKEAGAGR